MQLYCLLAYSVNIYTYIKSGLYFVKNYQLHMVKNSQFSQYIPPSLSHCSNVFLKIWKVLQLILCGLYSRYASSSTSSLRAESLSSLFLAAVIRSWNVDVTADALSMLLLHIVTAGTETDRHLHFTSEVRQCYQWMNQKNALRSTSFLPASKECRRMLWNDDKCQ